jgi:RimJ/RimL family protein N-acetyltransferase
VLEKLGFVREAYFRENHFNGQTFEDSAVYSRIAPI